MFDEPDPPKPKATLKVLDTMSIAELEEYVAALGVEADRARAAIATKKAHAEAAAQFFKTST
jgi:uncharacterized small protein (DUF1192 family)